MATFGKTTLGSSSSTSNADKVAVSSASPSETGQVVTGHAELGAASAAPTKFAIYADDGGTPGALLAESDVLSPSISGARAWRTFTFSGANQITVEAGVTYWIGPAWEGGHSVEFGRDSNSSMRREGTLSSWPTLTSPSWATAQTGPMAAYVTFNTSTPKPATDSGTGTDTVTSILRASDLTDSGIGTDDLVATVLAPNLTDSGTGSDAILVEAFTPVDLTDTGTGSDTVTVDKTDLISLTDSGTGTDTASGFATTDLTDSGAATDDLTGLNRLLTDSGVGTETITVLDIPFTQVLPPSRLGNLYDLVVMARVPQQTNAPLFLDVDPIEWTELAYTSELSAPSELQAGCQISSLTPVLIERFRNLATNPVELWLYRNGRLVFSGPLRGGQVNGEQLTLTAKGVLDYLKHMYVTQDLTYKAVDQHTIVKNLVDHWQNLDYGNFGINTSNISPSGVTRDVTYLKNELHNIGQRVEDLSRAAQGFDVEVDPETRSLLLWHPQRGVDRSSGEDAVVFDSRNITSSSVVFSAAVNDIATEAFGTGNAVAGDGPKYATASNAELRAKYGRAGVTGTWSEVGDQASLDNHVQALVDARAEALIVPGPETRETPDSDVTSYAVGDTVLYQPNELLMVSAPFRIRKRTVRVTGSGRESVSLEFA